MKFSYRSSGNDLRGGVKPGAFTILAENGRQIIATIYQVSAHSG